MGRRWVVGLLALVAEALGPEPLDELRLERVDGTEALLDPAYELLVGGVGGAGPSGDDTAERRRDVLDLSVGEALEEVRSGAAALVGAGEVADGTLVRDVLSNEAL
jgi:hypothetical protein